jgi:hypothetical protein
MLVLIVSFSLQNIMWVVVMGQIIYFSVTRRLPFFNKPSLWGLSHLFSSSSSLFTARYLVPGTWYLVYTWPLLVPVHVVSWVGGVEAQYDQSEI